MPLLPDWKYKQSIEYYILLKLYPVINCESKDILLGTASSMFKRVPKEVMQNKNKTLINNLDKQ